MFTNKIKILVAILFCVQTVQAQIVNGVLKQHAGEEITLTGFNNFKTIELSKTVVDSLGCFSLKYPNTYRGMAFLKTANATQVLLLTQPTVTLKGTHLTEKDSLFYGENTVNSNYLNYDKAKAIRDAAWLALKYVQPLYTNEKELSSQKKVAKNIANEIKRLEQADINFRNSLSKTAYLYWFLPMRQLITDMPISYKRYTERLPQNISQFRSINFNNPNFKTSGLLKELIEGHFMLLESMQQPVDSMYTQMNTSTQYLIDNLLNNEPLLNEVSKELFNYFEKRNLLEASDYLSVSLLSNNECALNDDLAAKLKAYNNLKVGAIAPDITLDSNTKLSNLKTTKLLVFGASWCPHCKTSLTELKKYSELWKTKNVEIIYISIDTDKNAFDEAYKNMPWQSYCDYNGWDTQAAIDYAITGTPSYFLIGENQKILVRPNSVEHANAWITHKL